MNDEKSVKRNDIVEIRRRHAVVSERSREINETYSSLLSALIFPYVLQKTLFSENSPFYQIFIDYFSTYTPQITKQMDEGIAALGKLADVRENLDGMLENLPPPGRFAHLIKPDFSEGEIIKAARAAVAEICRHQGCRTEAEAKTVLKTVTDEIIQEAHLHALRAFKNVKIKGLDFLAKNHPRFIAEMEFTNLMNIPKVFGVLLGKRFIMDPLLQRFFRNNVEPLPRFLEVQSPEEQRRLMKQLEATEKAQKNPAQRAANLSMSILPLLLIFYLLQAATEFRVPQTVWLMCFSLAISGSTHALYTAKKRYDERDYKKTLGKHSLACQRLFAPPLTKMVTAQDFRSLKNSRIMVTFNAHDNLNASQICRMVVHVLKNNGVVPVDTLGDSLWLKGSTSLSNDKIKKIQTELLSALEQKKTRSAQKDAKPLDLTLWEQPEEIEPKAKIRKNPTAKQNASRENSNVAPQPAAEETKNSHVNWKTVPTEKKARLIINAHGKNRFTFFNLRREDFPSDACFKKFQPLISDDPRVVPLRANQGLVHSKKFGGTLKAKALGEFGNVRIYATKKEVAETGETLYIFDKLVPKAH
jgi:hypothetical protein